MPTAQGLQRGGQIARAVRTGVTSGRLRRDSPISHHSSPVSRRGATGRQRDSSSIPGAQRRHAVAARPGPHRRAAHGHREQRGRVISRARRGQDSRSRRTVRRPPAIGCVQRWKPPTSSTGPPSSRATSARARARACGGSCTRRRHVLRCACRRHRLRVRANALWTRVRLGGRGRVRQPGPAAETLAAAVGRSLGRVGPKASATRSRARANASPRSAGPTARRSAPRRGRRSRRARRNMRCGSTSRPRRARRRTRRSPSSSAAPASATRRRPTGAVSRPS